MDSALHSNFIYLSNQNLEKNKVQFPAICSNLDASNPTILLVENDKELLAYLNKELKVDYTILRASNREEALEILNQQEVHLVLSEIKIPDLDGILLCRQIKSDPQLSHIPVIFMSSQYGIELKILGLNNGADIYIEKPFSLEFLKAQIQNILLNRQKIKNFFTNTRNNKSKKNDQISTDHFMDKLNLLIEENISMMDITVNLLARLMNVSRPTLYRKVEKYSSLKPNELIRHAKLKKAAELLQTKKYTVTQVSSMVGYSVQSNFSRDFNKYFGVRPSVYL